MKTRAGRMVHVHRMDLIVRKKGRRVRKGCADCPAIDKWSPSSSDLKVEAGKYINLILVEENKEGEPEWVFPGTDNPVRKKEEGENPAPIVFEDLDNEEEDVDLKIFKAKVGFDYLLTLKYTKESLILFANEHKIDIRKSWDKARMVEYIKNYFEDRT